MKKLFYLLATLGALLLAACGKITGELFQYDRPENYTVGGTSLTQPVKRLEIYWLAGSVNLETGDAPELSARAVEWVTTSGDLTLRRLS